MRTKQKPLPLRHRVSARGVTILHQKKEKTQRHRPENLNPPDIVQIQAEATPIIQICWHREAVDTAQHTRKTCDKDWFERGGQNPSATPSLTRNSHRVSARGETPTYQKKRKAVTMTQKARKPETPNIVPLASESKPTPCDQYACACALTAAASVTPNLPFSTTKMGPFKMGFLISSMWNQTFSSSYLKTDAKVPLTRSVMFL